MAMVKCRECGEKVSSKAKVCQHCGVKKPHKTHTGKIITGVFVGSVIAVGVITPPPEASSTATTEQKPKVVKKAVEKPAWQVSAEKDRMTGKINVYASSPVTRPLEQMAPPYHNTKGWVGVGCDGTKEWTYIGFTNQPNITNAKPQRGSYSTINARIKWNETVSNVSLTQDWGSKFIHFKHHGSAIAKLAGSNTVLLQLRCTETTVYTSPLT